MYLVWFNKRTLEAPGKKECTSITEGFKGLPKDPGLPKDVETLTIGRDFETDNYSYCIYMDEFLADDWCNEKRRKHKLVAK